MQTKPISRYISFGTGLRYLLDVQIGNQVHGNGYILDTLKRFFNYLSEFSLPVTQRAAKELRDIQDKLTNSDREHKMDPVETKKMKTAIKDIRKTLLAETAGKVAFIVTDKRIDVNKLLNDVSMLMAPEVFSELPQVAQYDFKQAGRCIAFEIPTAGGFHLLRGTEAVLRHFYRSIVKRDRVKTLLWGPMVEHLRNRRTPPPAVLLNNLDNIRQSFRNPTQHPDKIYDIQEVQDLFGLCIEVVNRMVKSKHWQKLYKRYTASARGRYRIEK